MMGWVITEPSAVAPDAMGTLVCELYYEGDLSLNAP